MKNKSSKNLNWINSFQLLEEIEKLANSPKDPEMESPEHRDTQCLICKRWFLLSDPKICEVNNGEEGHTPYKGVCKDCWILITRATSWIKYFQEIISVPIYEYEKIKIPGKLRWAIWERDNFTCQICGRRKNLTIDHKRPEINGGSLDMENLQTLCKSCNSRKGGRY